MKIYLAAGFSIQNVPGRERFLSKKFRRWNRLISFFWMNYLLNSDILNIAKEQHLKNKVNEKG